MWFIWLMQYRNTLIQMHGMDNFKILTEYLNAHDGIHHEQRYTNEFLSMDMLAK